MLMWVVFSVGWRGTELQVCGSNTVCYAVYSVYRVTFGLTCFHILFALLLIGVSSQNDFRFFIQGGSMLAWLVKIVLWLGAMVGMFFVPNIVFYYFGTPLRHSHCFWFFFPRVAAIAHWRGYRWWIWWTGCGSLDLGVWRLLVPADSDCAPDRVCVRVERELGGQVAR